MSAFSSGLLPGKVSFSTDHSAVGTDVCWRLSCFVGQMQGTAIPLFACVTLDLI